MSISSPGVHDADWFAAPASGDEELPLFDPAVLRDLEEQLGRADIALDFAREYANMWEKRRRHLVESMQRQDREAALDAAISLKVSSSMVGAVRLAHQTATLESTIRSGNLNAAGALLSLVAGSGIATMNELQASYISPATPPGAGSR
ncbi:Hpt domain-containing protein [Arthrobacter sp. 92]|uniref:Hpt domain-containing protein n=1 Tax=Arthrobacter sp. 92 TaxID=3418175 RepID=UPI003D06AE66